MHGEDYVCLGFLFGERYKVAYISDISRFLAPTENCKHHHSHFSPCLFLSIQSTYLMSFVILLNAFRYHE